MSNLIHYVTQSHSLSVTNPKYFEINRCFLFLFATTQTRINGHKPFYFSNLFVVNADRSPTWRGDLDNLLPTLFGGGIYEILEERRRYVFAHNDVDPCHRSVRDGIRCNLALHRCGLPQRALFAGTSILQSV